MPQEESQPQNEVVSLQFKSAIPSRNDVAGIHHVLQQLAEIDRRLSKINQSSVSPMGIQASSAVAATRAIDSQAAATLRLVDAQNKLAKLTVITSKSPATQASSVTIKQLRSLGPGISEELTTKPNGDTSLKRVEDYEKSMRYEEKKRKDAMNWYNKAVVYGQKLEIAKQHELENKKRLLELQRRLLEIDRRRSALISEGYRVAGPPASIFDPKTGLTKETEVLEKLTGGRVNTAKIVTVKNELGGVVSGGMSVANTRPNPRDMRDFFTNLSHVSEWAASVGVLYGGLRVARNAMSNLIQTSLQVARLTQVFSGVGGSIRELTDDILRNAVAERRSRDEAMDSAIAWSRLGLNRVGISEAVRVSLRAANVAEMTASESTEHLISIMQGYRLEIGQLAGVLGEINQISNTWNITNKDLIAGFAKVAPIARMAGISFSETMGLISAGRGTTGMSGTNFGNALKSVIGSMNDPRTQKMLLDKFHITVQTNGEGEVKNMSRLFQDLFLTYIKLNDAQRSFLVYQVARKNQAARLGAMLDSYIRAQVLSINAQQNLNSAEKESALIKASLSSQLKGLSTEWDRFIIKQGQGAPSQAIILVTDSLRNLLHIINSPVMSTAFGGIIALSTIMAAKMMVVGYQMDNFGGKAGFVVNSLRRLRDVGGDLGVITDKIISSAPATKISNKKFNLVDEETGKVIFGGFNKKYAKSISDIPGTKIVHAEIPTLVGQLSTLESRFNRVAVAGGRMSTMARIAAVSFRALNVAFISVKATLLPLLTITAGMWAINKVIDTIAERSEAASRRIAGFNDEAEQAAKNASAFAQAEKLMDTVGKTISSKIVDNADKMKVVKEAMESAYTDKNGNPDTAKNNAVTSEINALIKAGDLTKAQAVVDRVRNNLAVQRMHYHAQEIMMIDKQTEELNSQIKVLEDKKEKGNLSASGSKELLQLREQLRALQDKKSGVIVKESMDMNEEYSNKIDNDVRHLALLEREKLLAQSIKEIYADTAGLNPTDKLNAEIAGLQASLRHQQAMKEALENDPSINTKSEKDRLEKEALLRKEEETIRNNIIKAKADVESAKPGYQKALETQRLTAVAGGAPSVSNVSDSLNIIERAKERQKELEAELKDVQERIKNNTGTKTYAYRVHQQELQALDEQIKNTQKELAAKDDPEVRATANIQTKNAAISQGLKLNLESKAVGADEAEKLMSQKNYLDAIISNRLQLADLDGKALDDQERILMTMTAINEQERIRQQRNEMIARLQGEQASAVKEQAKEFQRSLLLSSPSDLLRKLAVKQLVDKGDGNVGLGGFMAFDVKARQDAMDYSPNLNRHIQDLQHELKVLGQRDSIHGGLSQTMRENALRNTLRGQYNVDVPVSPSISISAQTQAAVAELGRNATIAAQALSAFPGVIGRIVNIAESFSNQSSHGDSGLFHPVSYSNIPGTNH